MEQLRDTIDKDFYKIILIDYNTKNYYKIKMDNIKTFICDIIVKYNPKEYDYIIDTEGLSCLLYDKFYKLGIDCKELEYKTIK